MRIEHAKSINVGLHKIASTSTVPLRFTMLENVFVKLLQRNSFKTNSNLQQSLHLFFDRSNDLTLKLSIKDNFCS